MIDPIAAAEGRRDVRRHAADGWSSAEHGTTSIYQRPAADVLIRVRERFGLPAEASS